MVTSFYISSKRPGNETNIDLTGSNVQLIGSADFEWGRFYGFGQHWWDLGITVRSLVGYSVLLDLTICADAPATTGSI
jgi:hypothetical protein